MAGKRSGFGRLKIIILIGVLIYVGISYVSQQSVLSAQLKKQEELKQQQEELERQLDFKKSELDYIGSDEYVEQQARERLGWIKEDEIKYVDGTTSTNPPPGQDAQTQEGDTGGATGDQAGNQASGEPQSSETPTGGEPQEGGDQGPPAE